MCFRVQLLYNTTARLYKKHRKLKIKFCFALYNNNPFHKHKGRQILTSKTGLHKHVGLERSQCWPCVQSIGRRQAASGPACSPVNTRCQWFVYVCMYVCTHSICCVMSRGLARFVVVAVYSARLLAFLSFARICIWSGRLAYELTSQRSEILTSTTCLLTRVQYET